MKGYLRGEGGAGVFLAQLFHLAAASPALPRPYYESKSSLGQSCQAGAMSEEKSLEFQGQAWGHPPLPKRHPAPAQSDREPEGSAHLC